MAIPKITHSHPRNLRLPPFSSDNKQFCSNFSRPSHVNPISLSHGNKRKDALVLEVCFAHLATRREVRFFDPFFVVRTVSLRCSLPGESEEEFGETLDILAEIEYDDLYSFMYSPRPRTIAAKIYRDDISEEIKRDRLSKIQKLQGEISLRKNKERIGTVQEILVEGPAKLGREKMMGRTRSNQIVNINGPEGLRGKIVDVRISGASTNSLMGELISGSDLQ